MSELDDNKAIVCGITVIVIGVVFICAMLMKASLSEDTLKNDMIKNGATPAHMYCTFTVKSSTDKDTVKSVCGKSYNTAILKNLGISNE